MDWNPTSDTNVANSATGITERNYPGLKTDRLFTRAFTLTTNLLLDAGWRYNQGKDTMSGHIRKSRFNTRIRMQAVQVFIQQIIKAKRNIRLRDTRTT